MEFEIDLSGWQPDRLVLAFHSVPQTNLLRGGLRETLPVARGFYRRAFCEGAPVGRTAFGPTRRIGAWRLFQCPTRLTRCAGRHALDPLPARGASGCLHGPCATSCVWERFTERLSGCLDRERRSALGLVTAGRHARVAAISMQPQLRRGAALRIATAATEKRRENRC